MLTPPDSPQTLGFIPVASFPLLFYFKLHCQITCVDMAVLYGKSQMSVLPISSDREWENGVEGWAVTGPVLIAEGRDGLAGRTLPTDWKIRDQYPRSKFFTHTSVTFSPFSLGAGSCGPAPGADSSHDTDSLTQWKKSRLLSIPWRCIHELCCVSPRDIGLHDRAFTVGDHSCLWNNHHHSKLER